MKTFVVFILFTFWCCGFVLEGVSGEARRRPGGKKGSKNDFSDYDQDDLIPIPDHMLKNGEVHYDDVDEGNDVDYTDHRVGSAKDDSSPHVSTEAPSQSFGDGSLLPSVLPSTNLTQSALPIFLKEPLDTFVTKSQTAEIHCRVAHALSVHFQCNSVQEKPTQLEHHVEPESGVRYIEATLKINRDQVEEFFGDFHCACMAVSGKGPKISRHALITYAYLRKQFETPPYSQQVAVGSSVQMRCLPPKGKPTPTIYWLKGDRRIDPDKDKNFLLSGDNHLIVVSAQTGDSGNYTCAAENIASTRYSDPATLTVFADGTWSLWSSWSTCSPQCGKGTQKRTRSCKVPKSGGQPCEGPPVQKRSCGSPCNGQIDGNWAQWSSWSSCSPECFQHRRRTCSNPAPSANGRYCDGLDLESRNCSDGFCQSDRKLVVYGQVTDAPPDVSSAQARQFNSNVVIYISCTVAILVFILLILIAIKVIRRKSPNPNGYTLTSTDYGYGSDESKKTASLGYSPDIGATIGAGGAITPTTVCYEYSYPDSNSNHSKSGFVRPVSEHHYEQPMVVFPPNQSPADSIGKPTRSEASTSTTGSSSHGKGRSPQSTATFEGKRSISFPLASTPLPSSSDPKFTTWANVGHNGARVSLPDSNVFLTIPPGALPPGQTVDLYLSVIHNVQHPQLLGRETLLAPLVICGPKDVSNKLKKPVILSLPHSASLRHGNWSVSVLQNNDFNQDISSPGWHKIVTLGQETINTPVYAQLDLNMCHIMTDHLSAMTVTGESAKSGPAMKGLRLAAFAQEGFPAADLTIRIYCLPDTDDALNYVTEAERRYNGRLLDGPVSMLLQDGGEPLCLKIEGLSSNWICQKGADYLEVPFHHIWNSCNPSLHCSFTFRCRSGSNRTKLHTTIGISQRHVTSKSLLKINCDLSQRGLPPPQPPATLPHEQLSTNKFRLSQTLIQMLSSLLDPPNQQGTDWRLLAERLNVHRYVTYFATRPSPTEAILNLWEARNRELLAVSNLSNVLRGMGRFDAANVLERDSGTC